MKSEVKKYSLNYESSLDSIDIAYGESSTFDRTPLPESAYHNPFSSKFAVNPFHHKFRPFSPFKPTLMTTMTTTMSSMKTAMSTSLR